MKIFEKPFLPSLRLLESGKENEKREEKRKGEGEGEGRE